MNRRDFLKRSGLTVAALSGLKAVKTNPAGAVENEIVFENGWRNAGEVVLVGGPVDGHTGTMGERLHTRIFVPVVDRDHNGFGSADYKKTGKRDADGRWIFVHTRTAWS